MGAALELVGVEQRWPGAPVQHRGELPREVCRVTDAGAHPLADERWRLVRGIAEEEDVPAPEAPRDE